ncbi:neuraminidase-like domain-containing protein [Xenorhabdus sp. XENO-1]|uniref:Tc toxin subunit A-related protein n=1 Tax=Xenorhabdus bovienii TaxID=40576 RepID=UPI0020CA95A4|nr:neuraminidase-like domain-containing protein [Xenorhabdus bovienii]MCP9266966.1 neuraminidase-like domain-containing protein [Xenorhabdus bovienii subsp. africana]
MYSTAVLLNKISPTRDGRTMTLADLQHLSFSELRKTFDDQLSWGESHYLYREAVEQKKHNRLLEARVFTRANPQLSGAIRRGIERDSASRSYDEMFGSRSSSFVNPGSVASMFSPAGYLTELYREAKDLHFASSAYNLNVRRLDLATLTLSQQNMDEEISTLTLSNELLMAHVEKQTGQSGDSLLEMFSTERRAVGTPYHQPYESLRHAILAQDPGLEALSRNPDVMNRADTSSLLAIAVNISPELCHILTEEVTTENAEALFEQNFAEGTEPEMFSSVNSIARYYNLTTEEVSQYLGMMLLDKDSLSEQNLSLYTNNIHTGINIDNEGKVTAYRITKKNIRYSQHQNYWDLMYKEDNTFYIRANFKKNKGRVSVKRGEPGTTGNGLSVIPGPTNANINYNSPDFKLSITSSSPSVNIFGYRYTANGSRAESHASATFTFESYPLTLFALKLNKAIRLCQATGLSPSELESIVYSDNVEGVINNSVLEKVFYTLFFCQRYGLVLKEALVLGGAVIGQHADDNDVSHFDRLFNTPPLASQYLSADGSTISIDPVDISSSHPRDTLLRGLAVNGSELYQLALMAGLTSETNKNLTLSPANISALYRIKLMADVHLLTVNELRLLFAVSTFRPSLKGKNGNEEHGTAFVAWLYQVTHWREETGITPELLWLLTTTDYGTTLTPEMDNLRTMLDNHLVPDEINHTPDDTLLTQAAPYIAATLGLSSPEMAHAILQWCAGSARAGEMTLKTFLTLAVQAELNSAEEQQLTRFCHVLAQLALSVQTLHSWLNVAQTLQWVDVANQLSTMPTVVKSLVDIRYISGEQPSWSEWKQLASRLEAGLSPRQAQALETHTSGRLSEVLSTWFLANIHPDGVLLQNRDDLYSYFLIDNQVSSAVKTTRLAEAIAGIQLYINRALNRIEPNTRADVSTRQFFTDWAVNNRYSTWGGVSRLVYYPENYIDPTQRIGQTRMMDELLENISQSKLSRDTVEEAFKTYLTRFETVADLKVVSAYHDNVSSDTGLTWFVGQTRENLPEYYWRNVDISRMQAGKLAANAWKEWTKIDTAVSPYRDAIRPVIFRERLHLIWVEKDEVAKNGTDPVEIYDRFTLKLAFLRHDGSWSAPWVYDITKQVMDVTDDKPETKRLGLAASCFQGEDTLLVFVYQTGENYNDFGDKNKNVAGMAIYGDGSLKKMDHGSLSRYSQLKNTFDIINTTDSGLVRKACYRFAQDFEVPTSLTMGAGIGDRNLTVIEHGAIPQITGKYYSSERFEITLHDATFTVRYDGSGNALRNKQLRAMKCIEWDGKSQIGDALIIADTGKHYGGLKDNGGPIVVYNKTRNWITSVQDHVDGLPGDAKHLILTPVDMGTGDIGNIESYNNRLFKFGIQAGYYLGEIFDVGSNKISDFRKCNYAVVGHTKYSYFRIFSSYKSSGWLDIDTGANPAGIQITVIAGSKTHRFTAEDHALALPPNSWDGMQYTFNPLVINAAGLEFCNNAAPVDITFEATAKDGQVLGKAHQTLTVRKRDYTPASILSLRETAIGAQYMQLGVYRIRLNTLLAPQLVSRANTGIDTILTMATQQLPEPQLGKGFYATFTLPPYKQSTHGTNRAFRLHLKHVVDDNTHIIYSGLLQDTELAVRLFIPLDDKPLQPNFIAKVFLTTQKSPNDGTWNGPHFTDDGGKIGIHAKSDISMFAGVQIHNGATTEPLDFNSACALYYWELFYYTPMMCFQRLLQEKQFDEASKWMNYVYNPAGYIVNGEIAPWIWNCRPLEETTSWNANPLDAVDPDAVAQNDPTHYKVATFMRLLDQLITRGDMAYRELTRDALNESKMWYVRALELLGDEPEDYGSRQWAAPSLSVAASQTVQATYQQDLAALGRGEVPTPSRTANSLVGLFLPEYNPALTDYWKTLRLRLFNLRNNLSIDGQPLSLAIYAEPTDPKALLTSMVQASQGGSALPTGTLSLYRFPVMLERARNLVGQLTQFGAALLSMAEHDDADELTTLLLQQGMELATQSIRIQQRTVDEAEADIAVLKESRRSAQNRQEKYQRLYDEDINHGEQRAMSLFDAAAGQTLAGQALSIAEGVADLVPNVFGFACGGSRWGAALRASASVLSFSATASQYSAEKISRSESYRRRRQEWEIQRDNADSEVRQMDAQLEALTIRREAAQMQVEYQETQQAQTQAQLELLQRKFTNKALYSWMRGKLSAIYYQFFDLTQSFCLMAQEALRRELTDNGVTFIRGGVWNGTTAGLMAGETLLLNLAEMEKAWLERDERALEVTRTVSLTQVYQTLSSDSFNLAEKLTQFLRDGRGSAGITGNELKLNSGQMEASVRLSDLNIFSDYAESLGRTRQLKQVSVTLPTLVGPYEDIRAVLNYGGSVVMPRGCSAIALSHGMNDSGQFMLDFNDARYLPFEGIPVNDGGSLTLSFPDATDRQKEILQSLSDIILHIRYTIRS